MSEFHVEPTGYSQKQQQKEVASRPEYQPEVQEQGYTHEEMGEEFRKNPAEKMGELISKQFQLLQGLVEVA